MKKCYTFEVLFLNLHISFKDKFFKEYFDFSNLKDIKGDNRYYNYEKQRALK